MVDINKHRLSSSYSGLKSKNSSEFIRETMLNQAINDFDLYSEYALNSRELYVNDSAETIRGTFVDVSDLEVLTDTKWLLTSLKDKVNNGDIITEKKSNRKWICIYDKDKTTQTCYKVKIQPCTYPIKIPYINDENIPSIYVADAISLTYITDMKDYKQPFPTENGTTFISVQYNELTSKIKKQDRIWFYDSYEIIGIDYTNVNNYEGHGILKWTLRPTLRKDEYDNYELGICDYYKYFKKDTSSTTSTSGSIQYEISNKTPKPLEKVTITASGSSNVKFIFDGDNLGCTLTNPTTNSCVLNTSTQIGIVYVKCYLENSQDIYSNIRIVIKS